MVCTFSLITTMCPDNDSSSVRGWIADNRFTNTNFLRWTLIFFNARNREISKERSFGLKTDPTEDTRKALTTFKTF